MTAAWMRCFVTALLLFVGLVSELPARIPIAQIKGLDDVLSGESKKYSPLIGAIYSSNHFIENLYKYGVPSEPLVELVRTLFNEVPGGEVTTTHIANNPASHLSPSSIARMILLLESTEMSHFETDLSAIEALSNEIVRVIVEDSDYLESTRVGREAIAEAEREFSEFMTRYERSSARLQEAKSFDKKQIVPIRRKIKKLKKSLKKAPKADAKKRIDDEIDSLEGELSILVEQHREMSQNLLSASDLREAKRRLGYKKNANDTSSQKYQIEMQKLVSLLIHCFRLYDRSPEVSVQMPQDSTKKTLLAYMWEKYDHKRYLETYYRELSRAGLIPSRRVQEEPLKVMLEQAYSEGDYREIVQGYQSAVLKGRWYSEHFADVVATVIEKPNPGTQTPTIPFSFVKWVKYSLFPDCVENSLMNFFNHLIYNAEQNIFDVGVLERLRADYYPQLNQKLIDFYRRVRDPKEAFSTQTATMWIRVVSDLNQGIEDRDKSQKIHYRHGHTHVASPYTNFVRVVNRLLGYDDIATDRMPEIMDRIGQVTGIQTAYNQGKMGATGFGEVSFSFNQEVLVIKAHRPVHFSFEKRFVDAGEGKWTKLFGQTQRQFQRRSIKKLGKKRSAWKKQRYEDLSTLFIPEFVREKRDSLPKNLNQNDGQFSLFVDYSMVDSRKLVSGWVEMQSKNGLTTDRIPLMNIQALGQKIGELPSRRLPEGKAARILGAFAPSYHSKAKEGLKHQALDQWLTLSMGVFAGSLRIEERRSLLSLGFPEADGNKVSYKRWQDGVARSDGIFYSGDGRSLVMVTPISDVSQGWRKLQYHSEICSQVKFRWGIDCIHLIQSSEKNRPFLDKLVVNDKTVISGKIETSNEFFESKRSELNFSNDGDQSTVIYLSVSEDGQFPCYKSCTWKKLVSNRNLFQSLFQGTVLE